MDKYYVNRNPQNNRDHEVHKIDCTKHPIIHDIYRWHLGDYTNSQAAIVAAKRIYTKSEECKYCSPDCHPGEGKEGANR